MSEKANGVGFRGRTLNVKALFLSLLIACGATGAKAVDLPVYKAIPVFNWTGFYVGGHVGHLDGRMVNPVATLDLDGGLLAGAQLGYNWQFNRNWVFGIEADISSADTGFNIAAAVFSEMQYLGTVRVRLGIAHNNWLFYATGGFAYARNEIVFVTPRTASHAGYAIGGGIEWAFHRHWSAKIEYLYIDFDEENYMLANPIGFELNTFRFGLNYRF